MNLGGTPADIEQQLRSLAGEIQRRAVEEMSMGSARTGTSARRYGVMRFNCQLRIFSGLSVFPSRDIRRGHSPWRWPTRFIVSPVNRVAMVEPLLTGRSGKIQDQTRYHRPQISPDRARRPGH